MDPHRRAGGLVDRIGNEFCGPCLYGLAGSCTCPSREDHVRWIEEALRAEAELAWAAGLFDGEGSAGVYRQKTKRTRCGRSPAPRVQVGMTDRPALERLQRALGHLGSITGPYRAKGSTQRHWNYVVASRQALRVAELLMPRVTIKESELRSIIDHYERADTVRRRKAERRKK